MLAEAFWQQRFERLTGVFQSTALVINERLHRVFWIFFRRWLYFWIVVELFVV